MGFTGSHTRDPYLRPDMDSGTIEGPIQVLGVRPGVVSPVFRRVSSGKGVLVIVRSDTKPRRGGFGEDSGFATGTREGSQGWSRSSTFDMTQSCDSGVETLFFLLLWFSSFNTPNGLFFDTRVPTSRTGGTTSFRICWNRKDFCVLWLRGWGWVGLVSRLPSRTPVRLPSPRRLSFEGPKTFLRSWGVSLTQGPSAVTGYL